jgi:hypothetical protein
VVGRLGRGLGPSEPGSVVNQTNHVVGNIHKARRSIELDFFSTKKDRSSNTYVIAINEKKNESALLN